MTDYGMYTVKGDKAIGVIVEYAKLFNYGWSQVENLLSTLSENPDYAEALDTEVRSAVYNALRVKTPFYS